MSIINFSKLVLLVFVALFFVGCSAPRGLNHSVTKPKPIQETILTSQETQFIDNILKIPTGGAHVVAWTPLGENITILAKETYYSAIGRTCKKFYYVHSTGKQQFVICKEEASDIWRYVEPIN